MKAWLKGGLIGLGIFLVGLILMGIQEFFLSGSYFVLQPLYEFILFSFMRLFFSGESGRITADLSSFIIMPFVWFIIGAIIGWIVGKVRKK